MIEMLATAAVGIFCIVIGILNTRGNISMLHSYHRNRVSEEDRLPFGRTVGAGMIVIGGGILVFSALSAITLRTAATHFTIWGTVILVASFCVGLGLAFYAMIKYNKGIF